MPAAVSLGDGRSVEALGKGTVKLILQLIGKVKRAISFRNVLYIPKLAANLFSVRAVTERGYIVQFGHTRCWINDVNKRVRAMGTLYNRLFMLDCEQDVGQQASVAIDKWHQRLVM